MPRRLPVATPLLSVLLLAPLTFAASHHSREIHKRRAEAPEAPPPASNNPLLPPQIPLESLLPDTALVRKEPGVYPAGIVPLYTAADWAAYRAKFGEEADLLGRKKASELIAFSEKLIAAAGETDATPGLRNLLLVRAAIDCYRTRNGFPTANKAVTAFMASMDTHSVAGVAALWTMANAMSRSISTPRPDRIHYSAIAAKANMQLTILLLQMDQLAPAQSLMRLIGYHEGWVHTASATPADRAVYPQIAKVRKLVQQTTATMDYLATQYQPAINGDDDALMAIYLYGRYVKGQPALVADLPGRKPSSPMAQLAAQLDAAERHTDPIAPYEAAQMLRIVAGKLPEGGAAVLKQRTLYAALQNYRAFIADPRTEKNRVKRTLARMAIESVISDGAHGPAPVVNPFAPPPAPKSEPAKVPEKEPQAQPGASAKAPAPAAAPARAARSAPAAGAKIAPATPAAGAAGALERSSPAMPAPALPSMPEPTTGPGH